MMNTGNPNKQAHSHEERQAGERTSNLWGRSCGTCEFEP